MIVALADTFVAAINGAAQDGTFTGAFTAQRRFATLRNLEDIPANAETMLVVVPAADTQEREGGGAQPIFSGEYELDVVLYARVGTGEPAERKCADLMALRQQIGDYGKDKAFIVQGPKTAKAVLMSIDGSPAFGQRTLIENACFVSLQTLRFRMIA
jgi:hypothetical protein